MKEKKTSLLPIYFKCDSYICLHIQWYMLIHLQLSCAETEIGNNVKCRIRTKTNNTQTFERENDLYRIPNSCMWSRSLLEQDKGGILCYVKCSLREHWCRAKCKRGADRSVQLMSASYSSITQCARDLLNGTFWRSARMAECKHSEEIKALVIIRKMIILLLDVITLLLYLSSPPIASL